MQYRTTKRESFFLIIYTVYMIVLLLSQTAFEEMGAASSIFKYVRYLCYFLAALLILQDSYREKQIWGVAILGVLTVGTVVCSGNSTFILYLIMILAAKEVNVRTIVKLTCIIQGAMLLSIVVMSQIGIIPDYIFDASTRQRHGLGFLWTTTGAILYFYFMVLYIYLREERAHLIEYVILEAVNFGLYKLTDARMSFYLVHIAAGLRLCHAFLLAEPQGSDPQEPASDRCTGIFLYPCRGMSDFLYTDRCTLAEDQQCALRTTGTGMLWMERLWLFSARNKNRVDRFQPQCNGRSL